MIDVSIGPVALTLVALGVYVWMICRALSRPAQVELLKRPNEHFLVPVQVKRTHPDAVLPEYAHPDDGALDLTAVDDGTPGTDGDYISYDTGLAFAIPDGYVGLLFPRSSISKTHQTLANCVGVLDAGHRSSVTFRFRHTSLWPTRKYKKGDRIGQIMVIPRPFVGLVEVGELPPSTRGTNGYGSTGA